MDATITLSAETLAQAAAAAIALVSAAFGREPVRCEVMTTSEFDARNGLEPVPELASVTEASQLLGVTRQAVLQRIDSGSIPATKVGTTWVISRTVLDVLTQETDDAFERMRALQWGHPGRVIPEDPGSGDQVLPYPNDLPGDLRAVADQRDSDGALTGRQDLIVESPDGNAWLCEAKLDGTMRRTLVATHRRWLRKAPDVFFSL